MDSRARRRARRLRTVGRGTRTLAAEASRYRTNNITFNGYRPGERINSRSDWPWPPEFWKPSDDPVRNLVKAGALIAAEIDRQAGGQLMPSHHPSRSHGGDRCLCG